MKVNCKVGLEIVGRLGLSIVSKLSFHFLVSQHHTSDVKSLGLVMLEEVKR